MVVLEVPVKPQWREIRNVVFNWTRTKFPFQIAIGNWQLEVGSFHGVLAQLVERLNGIEEVRGSNPLGSKIFLGNLELALSGSNNAGCWSRANRLKAFHSRFSQSH
jgi:hypothetical protein